MAVAVQVPVDHELQTVAYETRDRTRDRVNRASGRIRTERSNIRDRVVVLRHVVESRIAAASIPTSAIVAVVAGVVHRIAAAVIPAADLARTHDRVTLVTDTCTDLTRAVQCHPDDGISEIGTILVLLVV